MAAIPYLREMEVAYGRADRVSPLITRVLAENPGPFTFHGTGTYLVGERSLAVIDPGPRLDAHLDALLAAIAGRKVEVILTTHTHADHSPLAHPLQEKTGAPILGRAAPAARTEGGEPDEGAFRPDEEIADGAVVEGDGWTLTAAATPGHTSNHVGYALAEENAFFCGDHVMGWSTTVVIPPDGDMGDYYASLDRVRAMGFDTLWPTHGPPIERPGPFIDAYRAHRRLREAQIEGELAKGPRTIAAMVPRLYAGIDARLRGAAARSTWAHLILMVRQGRATADGPATLEATYALT